MTVHTQRCRALLQPVLLLILLCLGACDGGSSGDCLTGEVECEDGCCQVCSTDLPCADDGVFCNGEAACVDGLCITQERDCDDAVGCTIDFCDETQGACRNELGLCDEGEVCDPLLDCIRSGVACTVATEATDCDDSNPCTADSCDSEGLCVYESLSLSAWYPDLDGDGFGNDSVQPVMLCVAPGPGWVEDNTDCDDAPAACGAACNPDLTEVCDDYDNNCSEGIDEGCDDDLDGYCDAAIPVVGDPEVCPLSATDLGDDCDDDDPSLTLVEDWYADCDGDGDFETLPTSSCGVPGLSCLDGEAPDGGWATAPGSDCDDEDPTAYTGCDGLCSTTPCLSCDCAGVCNGPAVVDCAGTCDGSASIGCDGECSTTPCLTCDCAGTCDGLAVVDCAGTCDGSASIGCDGVCSTTPCSTCDCAGVCNGPAVLDCAGTCDGSASIGCDGVCSTTPCSTCDCAGICNGPAIVDCAGTCDGLASVGCDGLCSTTPCADCGCGGVCNGPTLAPSPPGVITGPVSVCPGTGGYVYSVVPYAGVTSYDWTLPSGATVTAGQGTESVTVSYGSTMGEVSVTATNACASSSPSSLLVSDGLDATGGTITEVGDRRIHTFSATGPFTFTVNGGCDDAEVLVVGGGGKGGTSGGGGGGGGGHVIHETTVPFTPGSYSGVVGQGTIVIPAGHSGGDNGSPAEGSSFDLFFADPGTNGTGPGGDSGNTLDGVTTAHTGGLVFAPPSNGGGAGAGSDGENGSSSPGGPSGDGGSGLLIAISGTPTWYGGGGGAGAHCGSNCPSPGSGGLGGGGAGAQGGSCSGCFPKVGNSGSPALPNTGGGGGGGGGVSGCCHGYGGSGGSGLVIISYPL
ncbi:MAG: hypothetical protein VX498_10825 [Myxococcota bacterium]|nr:hypothetical protein [Myxococcota bacterium]